jgi:hypothetical protein
MSGRTGLCGPGERQFMLLDRVGGEFQCRQDVGPLQVRVVGQDSRRLTSRITLDDREERVPGRLSAWAKAALILPEQYRNG